MALPYVLSERCKRIPHSGIRRIFGLVHGADDVINLAIGEPDFKTPGHIVEAACKAARDGVTHYTANAGEIRLREAISAKLAKENGISVNPQDEVIITVGAMEALALAMLAVLEEGDEVILADPSYPNYLAQVILAGGVPVMVPVGSKEGFMLSSEHIKENLSSRTKAVILNTPCNPTGTILRAAEMEDIARLVLSKGLIVFSDEVYEKLMYDGRSHLSIGSLDGLKEHTVTFNSFSKTYAMTGWRVGYAAGPRDIIQGMIKLQEHVAACASSVSQAAALAAIQGPEGSVREMVRRYQIRRDLLVDGLSAIPGIACERPPATFYLFASIKPISGDSLRFAGDLIVGARVAVTPGVAFGRNGEGYIRICFANSEESLQEAVKRIREYITEYIPTA